MPTRLSIPVPPDFLLRRDACSYGYFLLAPNHWDPRREVFSRVVTFADGPALIEVAQSGKQGSPLLIKSSRTLSTKEKQEVKSQLTRMLRLDDTRETLATFHKLDPR